MEPHAQLRFNTWMVGLWSQVEFAYFQYLATQLDERIWKRTEYETETFLSLPGLSQWWGFGAGFLSSKVNRRFNAPNSFGLTSFNT